MVVTVLLLIPTALFLIRAIASLATFLKWHKAEQLDGRIGQFEKLDASGRGNKFTYDFTIERGDEKIDTHFHAMNLRAGGSRVQPGDVVRVYYDPKTGRYRVRKDTIRDLVLYPILFVLCGAAAYAVYVYAAAAAPW